MSYSENIDRRGFGLVKDMQGVERKKMFGGTCHLLHGNIFCKVHNNRLILRLGEAHAAELPSNDHVDEFDITGRPMKGWIMVGEDGFHSDWELAQWLDSARRFVLSLPAKNK